MTTLFPYAEAVMFTAQVDSPARTRIRYRRMKPSRRVFLGAAAWTVGISGLHAKLNVNWTALRNGLRSLDRLQTLVVGGLPVT